ncbi:hypothetical protein [Lutispora thermophila]|uniref:Uncharacterized protein n=1 Tax=Lutispora thermophila DSM 19022 TaxID=1122184 RepID=A0A1M6BBL6_9FIRM|nr:hypothetical protein [Lutispora thermophila]SHI46119.1 hypothetical protein SAMN02745176_00377 [Lutispora thermophila DSM 19022]
MNKFTEIFNKNSIKINKEFINIILLIDRVFDIEIELFELIGWTVKPEIQAIKKITLLP